MHARAKILLGVVAATGILLAGVSSGTAIAAPGPGARPLVDWADDVQGADGFVLSADESFLFLINSWDESSIYDLASRTVTQTLPPVQHSGSLYDLPVKAAGPHYAFPGWEEYLLLDLATGEQETFDILPRAGEDDPPMVNLMVADENSRVTGISDRGEFLVFDGGTITESIQLRDPDSSSWRMGTSRDGSLAFHTYMENDEPYAVVTIVVDMRTGAIVSTIESEDGREFEPYAIDVSGESIWGSYNGEYETAVNIHLETGPTGITVPVGWGMNDAFYGDTNAGWMASPGNPALGGSIAPGGEYGARQLDCCTTDMTRLSHNGDLVFYDVEMRRLGFITAPSITHPANATIAALGETVVFTSESEGLALSAEEPGAVEETPAGSIWQSSRTGRPGRILWERREAPCRSWRPSRVTRWSIAGTSSTRSGEPRRARTPRGWSGQRR